MNHLRAGFPCESTDIRRSRFKSCGWFEQQVQFESSSDKVTLIAKQKERLDWEHRGDLSWPQRNWMNPKEPCVLIHRLSTLHCRVLTSNYWAWFSFSVCLRTEELLPTFYSLTLRSLRAEAPWSFIEFKWIKDFWIIIWIWLWLLLTF